MQIDTDIHMRQVDYFNTRVYNKSVIKEINKNQINMARGPSGKFNTNYSQNVIFRMFGEDTKRMAEFHENYLKSRYTRTMRKASRQDFAFFADYKKGKLISEISQQHGVSMYVAESGVNRAARELAIAA